MLEIASQDSWTLLCCWLAAHHNSNNKEAARLDLQQEVRALEVGHSSISNRPKMFGLLVLGPWTSFDQRERMDLVRCPPLSTSIHTATSLLFFLQ